MITPEKLAKLPKWVQSEIERLNIDLARIQAKYDIVIQGGSPKEGDVVVDPYGRDLILPSDTTVQFGSLSVRLVSKGKVKVTDIEGNSVFVMPEANNTFIAYSARYGTLDDVLEEK